MSFLTQPFTLLGSVFGRFGHSDRYEHLFSLSDRDLNARGLDRENLVRGFITGFAYG